MATKDRVITMFEIVVTIYFLVGDRKMMFVSDTKYETMVECVASIPESYAQLNAHVMAHMIEKFRAERLCRSVEKGA